MVIPYMPMLVPPVNWTGYEIFLYLVIGQVLNIKWWLLAKLLTHLSNHSYIFWRLLMTYQANVESGY